MKKILILHTGGTIGMEPTKSGQKTLKLVPLERLFSKKVPELKKMAKIKIRVLDNLDSSNVSPLHWKKWLQVLKENYRHFDGFVMTHGTDSLAYTGSALSFALRKTEKPIVLTGSQRPLAHIRTDARDNLINAVEMACYGPKEVSICFGNELLRANRTTKLSATDYIAFETFNLPHLAKIGVNVERAWEDFGTQEKVRSGNPSWKNQFNERVFCFKIFPGISGEILSSTILNSAIEGVVLEAYGSGNVPTIDDSVIRMIKDAKSLGKPVVIVSQCPHGQVDLELYESGMRAKNAGALSAGDMTSEAAVVKLMHGLGTGLRGEGLQKYFLANICGERSLEDK